MSNVVSHDVLRFPGGHGDLNQMEARANVRLNAESDKRLQALLQALPVAVYTTDAAGRITFYNEAAAAAWGRRPELYTEQWCGSWRMYRSDGTPLPLDQCPMAIALREKRTINGQEAMAERADGTRVPIMAFPTILYDPDGNVVGAVNMFVDITERRRSEELAERLASIVESSDDAIITKDLDGTISSWNKGAERIFGYLAEEVIGKPVNILIPQDRQNEEPSILERVRRGERIDHYETVRMCKDGSLIEISLTVSPLKDANGKIIGASKIARDITEQKRSASELKRSQEQVALLAREAEHRSNNLLATVQATVHLTKSDTPEGLKEAIKGRIQSLANIHSLFVESRWAGAELHTLVTQELSPYRQDGETRVRIDGPSLLLAPNVAQTIAMTLHELATNAAKYGALSIAEGKVQIEWSRTAERQLVLRWIETDGPPVTLPTRRGFGTHVMEHVIRNQLNGEMRFDWRVEGLACEIVLPV